MASAHPAPSPFPERLLLEGKQIQMVSGAGKVEWTYEAPGPFLDAQPQPSGDWLVTGGPGKVFLLHHTHGKRPWEPGWDWSDLDTDPPVGAVAVDWDLDGRPTLVLAADAVKQRVFLAEAKGARAKVRWEFALPEAPRSVRVCPDSGNFLVTLPSQVAELDFKAGKISWSLPAEGAQDAARGPDSLTYVVDSRGKVQAFDAGKRSQWAADLDPQASDWSGLSLSLFEVRQGVRLLLSGTARTRHGRQERVWVLDAQDGHVLAEQPEDASVTRDVPWIEGME
ncbi:MAG TPA: PQQ-binding-like beta-propeller repeat protein [bacterium]|nr:PQQ-binding-like beta-propeller repeat protein [bacterium]